MTSSDDALQLSSDDALDFLESLVIFDHICPFAIEHLPAMSRRVFDVGLDTGRMRNSLRFHRDPRRNKSNKSTPTQDSNAAVYTDDTPNPQQLAMVPQQLKHRKSSPTLHDRGHQTQLFEEPVILPSIHRDSPLDPNRDVQPMNDTNGERSLHSLQLDPQSDSPTDSHTPTNPRRHSDGPQNFDLKPPPPNSKVKHIDSLSEQLFSADHLRIILKDPSFFLRFTAFLNRYRHHLAPVLVKYLEAQKALKAIEYANSLSDTPAATIDPRFQARAQQAFDKLLVEALPAYITSCLTKVVTEYMVREITGTGMPVMRELVGGLAEVFCLADPSIQDCPIVYASEEFYRTSRYTRDDVIGRNCRFLQGPKTNKSTVARLGAMVRSGQECCETVLNYRRDGSPFMNLLLIAPLHDNKGAVRYFIGAQIDVSGLVEEGRGLDSFERYLSDSKPGRKRDSDDTEDSLTQIHLKRLNELSQMLSVDESSVFQRHSRASSFTDGASSAANFSARRTPTKRDQSTRRPRLVLGEEDEEEDRDKAAWSLTSSLPSGRLPGVYQNYFLVRPYPSLRIIFVSPALRIPGLLQSPFLPHIGGPSHVRTGLAEAFEQGAAVTAKITWLPRGDDKSSTSTDQPQTNGSINSSRRSAATSSSSNNRMGNTPSQFEPKTRYISCTPMYGSDDAVGVWMVVMVENELVTGSLASRERALQRYVNGEYINGGLNGRAPPVPPTPSEYEREDGGGMGSLGSGVDEQMQRGKSIKSERRGKVGSEGGRLYADFMRDGVKNDSTQPSPLKPGFHSEAGEWNGVGDGRRVEEVFTPAEERGQVL